MSREKCQKASAGGKNLASIDVGSHTARLLVAQKIGPPRLYRPLLRKRVYIRLAEDFYDQGKGAIQPDAIERTLNALGDFAAITRRFGVESAHAVSTGVVREAHNRDEFLGLIHNRTGIKIKVITGEEEAKLTEKGVLHALNMGGKPSMIFDLGGGSTEFIYGAQDDKKVKSVPLGAMVLTQKYLTSDPPKEEEIDALVREVDGFLQKAFSDYHYSGNEGPLVGTGGTVTTLAAMIYGIDVKDINPDKMNGLILERKRLEDLFERIKSMITNERLKLPGLDRGRADVIPAGCMIVIRVLYFFRSLQMLVCLSDLLEGIVIAYLKGEEYA